MTLRLFIGMFLAPLALAVAAPCIAGVLGWALPLLLAGDPALTLLAGMSRQAAAPAMALVLLAALALAAMRMYRWQQWRHGDGIACGHCGGPVVVRDTGYGIYHTCYACGAMTHA